MNKNWFHLLIVLDLQQKKFPFQNFFFFLISEEKYATQQNTYLSKININELTDTLLENTEFISYFNSVVDTSCVDNFDDNTRERLFSDLSSLYLRARLYSLARDVVSKHKLYLKRQRLRALRKEIKKSSEKSQTNEWKEYHTYMQNGILNMSYSTNYTSIYLRN